MSNKLEQLKAMTLVVADTGLQRFNWEQLALISFLVQWVVLASAALLCPLRGFLIYGPGSFQACSMTILFAFLLLSAAMARRLIYSLYTLYMVSMYSLYR